MTTTKTSRRLKIPLVLRCAVAASIGLTACGSDADTGDDGVAEQSVPATDDAVGPSVPPDSGTSPDDTETASTSEGDDGMESTAPAASASQFQVDVWADNWMAVYVNGELVGEDSVPITTERSFNAESFTFEATAPFTLAIEAKDFKQTDSGIEYIGQPNQQMGDGGLIAQVTDLSTGEVVAATDASWSALVVHQAPLNTECEKDPDPDATCEFSIIDTPDGWTDTDFDDGDWGSATEWAAADVDPKDGYDQIAWDASARLIWGSDLEIDNTVLHRTTVG